MHTTAVRLNDLCGGNGLEKRILAEKLTPRILNKYDRLHFGDSIFANFLGLPLTDSTLYDVCLRDLNQQEGNSVEVYLPGKRLRHCSALIVVLVAIVKFSTFDTTKSIETISASTQLHDVDVTQVVSLFLP